MAADKSEWVIGKTLARQARERGDSNFIKYEDGDWITYAQAHRASNAMGNAFAGIGVQRGEQVIVMLHNRLEYIWCWYGLSRLGAAAVTVNTAYKGRFLTHVMTNTKSRFAVVEPEFLSWIADIEDTVPDLERVYVMDGVPADAPAFKRLEILDFDDLRGGAEDDIDVEVTYRDIGTIMFTSGTTGPSKSVLMPHGHLHLMGEAMKQSIGLTPDDRYYTAMPLFHAQGLMMQAYGTAIAGGSLVMKKNFSPKTWIDDVRESQATVTNLLGVMNDFVLAQPRRNDDADNNLRAICALPVTHETMTTLAERFGVNKFVELFGMTECNLPVWRPLDAPNEAGCSGKVWDEYFEVIVADPETDEPLPVGEVGEILVRPKEPFCFMQGYQGMDDRTVETWRNFWFHTGDAARFDERGYLWYIDRIKDTIRRRGENISSYEVEAVLLEHPDIVEVAAIAVKAEQGGEDEVMACIVLAEGAEKPDPAALLDYCAPRMPYFAVPRFLEFVDEIPKTPSSKIKKKDLRDRGLTPATWDRESVGYKVKRD
ncbi:MAG: AMP-binding protein [Minwuia sp.]|uniref:AMP-binding protein n=1 Tax=Minwuia sp. TaxID=2493630 RepID=UPI003A8BAEA2